MKKWLDKLMNDQVGKKKYLLRLIVCILISCFAACGLEIIKNRHVLSLNKAERVQTAVDFSLHEDVLVAEFPRQFVMGFGYKFQCDGNLEGKYSIRVSEPGVPEQFVSAEDRNPLMVNESYQSLGLVCDRIELKITNGDNYQISSVYIDNRFQVNWRRCIATFFATFGVCGLILFWSMLKGKAERIFVLLAVCGGMIILCSSPTTKTIWDEGIHFKNAYTTTFSKEIGATSEITTLMNDEALARLNPPQSYREYQVLNQCLDGETGSTSEKEIVVLNRSKISMYSVGYIFSGFAFTLGRGLHVSLSNMYLLAKFFNLAIYIILVFFAIKRCKIGKLLITIMALMPTPLFIAASLNRDSLLNACGFLGCAYLFSMMVEEEKIRTRDFLVAFIALCVVCAMKPVYAPLILLLLLLPRERFENDKIVVGMRLLAALGGVLIIASFVLPALNPNNSIGDSRGGDTSGPRQMRFILSNPLRFVNIFFNSVGYAFTEYLVGHQIWGNLGVFGVISENHLIALGLFFLALTEPTEYYLKTKEKIWTLVACTLMICFVWLSMYLSFTEVGSSAILGVQGRYFIVLAAPIMLTLRTKKIDVHYESNRYQFVTILATAIFVFGTLFGQIVNHYLL